MKRFTTILFLSLCAWAFCTVSAFSAGEDETPTQHRTITIVPCNGEFHGASKQQIFMPALLNGTSVETNKRPQNTYKAFSDTSRKTSFVRRFLLTSNNDMLNVWLDLAEDQDAMEVTAWNILGKKVKDFGKYSARAGTVPDSDTNGNMQLYVGDIPNGIYIIAIQGDGFRAAFRVTISR